MLKYLQVLSSRQTIVSLCLQPVGAVDLASVLPSFSGVRVMVASSARRVMTRLCCGTK